MCTRQELSTGDNDDHGHDNSQLLMLVIGPMVLRGIMA